MPEFQDSTPKTLIVKSNNPNTPQYDNIFI